MKNSFTPLVFFYALEKIWKNRFSNVLKGYRKRPVARNGFCTTFSPFKRQPHKMVKHRRIVWVCMTYFGKFVLEESTNKFSFHFWQTKKHSSSPLRKKKRKKEESVNHNQYLKNIFFSFEHIKACNWNRWGRKPVIIIYIHATTSIHWRI